MYKIVEKESKNHKEVNPNSEAKTDASMDKELQDLIQKNEAIKIGISKIIKTIKS